MLALAVTIEEAETQPVFDEVQTLPTFFFRATLPPCLKQLAGSGRYGRVALAARACRLVQVCG